MAKTEKNAAELYREERKARIAKAAKKNSKKSISSNVGKTAGKVIAIVVAVALIAGIGAFAVNRSGVLLRNTVAFTVGDREVSQAEYSYYYQSMYNTYAQYAAYGYISLNTSTALSAQEYDGSLGEIEDFPEDQTPMWSDFFEYATKQRIQYVKASVAKAEEMGLELTDADKAEVEKVIKQYDDYASSISEDGSTRYSLSAYLKASFGNGMSAKYFRTLMEEQQLAVAYEESKTNEYKEAVTEKQINKEYNDNILSYAVTSLRSYTFEAETVSSTDEDGNESAAVTDATMAAAKAKAQAFAAAVTDSESFKTLASEAEKEAGNEKYKDYLTEEDYTLSADKGYDDLAYSVDDEDFLAWAFDEDTAKNSTYVVEEEDSGYTVYFMENPLHKAADTYTYDSRHILIKFKEDAAESAEDTDSKEETTSADTEEETTEAETTAEAKQEVKVETLDLSQYSDVNVDLVVNAETAQNKAAYKEIQDILEEYLKGERTAEAFGALAEKYSEDTGSNEAGGLYEDTAAGDFVEPYDAWCLEDGRKEGDIALVEYSGSNYQGYHLIYFVARNTVTWKDSVIDALASEKLNEYVEELLDSDAAAISNIDEETCDKVVAQLDDVIKSNASSSSN